MIPKTTATAQFTVSYLQFLDEQSRLTQALPAFADRETLLHLYRVMSLVRKFDNKAINLQRIGTIGTFPAARGQEAVGVGAGHAMQKTDVFCPYYRDQGIALLRGIQLSEILSYWGGDERGSDYANPDVKEDFPICVPIAGQLLHAAGVAYAIKYRQQDRAVLVTCGEGGTSKGDFYEAINLACCWNLPMVILVNNNQWAISEPNSEQTACKTIAQKAIAAGFSGYQVDGNDVIAVRYSVDQALKWAREGKGPTLIEAVTYRLSDHTTADDASRYVPQEELKQAWKREPLQRLALYLESQGWWSKEKEAQLQEELSKEVEDIVSTFLQRPAQKPEDIFDYLYETLPRALQKQRDEVTGKL